MTAVLKNHPRLDNAVILVYSKGHEERVFFDETLEKAVEKAFEFVHTIGISFEYLENKVVSNEF